MAKRRQSGSVGQPAKKRAEKVVPEWKEFYTQARTPLDAGEESIDKVHSYHFPKDDDPTLDAAYEALNAALEKACEQKKKKRDTAEVKQALENLRKAYDEAAKSNTVMVHYVDAEPPTVPYSPLGDIKLKKILLARSWMNEVINGLRDQSLRRLLILGNPGSGKSVALVGYLLFYLIANSERTLLQSDLGDGSLGFVFDNDGVHEVFQHNHKSYRDGKPCCLLVSADGKMVHPLPQLGWCDRTIVVSSPNMKSKPDLKTWMDQNEETERFIAPPPSCLEVVYVLSQVHEFDSWIVYWMYREWSRDFRTCRRDCKHAIRHLAAGTFVKWHRRKTRKIKSLARTMLSGSQGHNTMHKLPDNEVNLQIPSALVTMNRFCENTDDSTDDSTDESSDDNESTNDNESIVERDDYTITFATGRIASIITDVQKEESWKYNWQTLKLYFRDPETRVAAGSLFQTMFLRKFRIKDPNTMPPCYELGNTTGAHLQSQLGEQTKAAMPWNGIGQQPDLAMLSVGKGSDGSLYSKWELKLAIDRVMDEDFAPICFLIPLPKNWASWDAALFLRSGTAENSELHVVFLQLTLQEDHDIVAKGLNQVKAAVPRRLNVHYHYVLVLLIEDEPKSPIPKWRHVLHDSKGRKKDNSWNRDNLKQYVMYVSVEELLAQVHSQLPCPSRDTRANPVSQILAFR